MQKIREFVSQLVIIDTRTRSFEWAFSNLDLLFGLPLCYRNGYVCDLIRTTFSVRATDTILL